MIRKHYYLGLNRETKVRELISIYSEDTEKERKYYMYLIGPFYTYRAAEWMRIHGNNNPHCQCVADAERLSKL
jgi:hypothetical protein